MIGGKNVCEIQWPDTKRNTINPEPIRNFRIVSKRFRQGLENILVGFKFLSANTYPCLKYMFHHL